MVGMKNTTVGLSVKDIDYLGRLVQTEVDHGLKTSDPEEYARQIKAATDTVLNRVGSGYFPNTVADVAGQDRQFSAINGPKTYRDVNGNVRATGSPGSVDLVDEASPDLQKIINEHVYDRARGVDSSVGDNLHYANPEIVSPNNAGWVNAMADQEGSITVGRAGRQHIHGTEPSFNRAKINTDISVNGFTPENGYQPFSPPKPRSRESALSAPVTPVESQELPTLFDQIQTVSSEPTPAQPAPAPVNMNPAPTPVRTVAVGPDPRDQAERDFGKTSDDWQTPKAIAEAFSRAREALQPATQTTVNQPSQAPVATQTQAPSQADNVNNRINSVFDQVPSTTRSAPTGNVGAESAVRPGYTGDSGASNYRSMDSAVNAMRANSGTKSVDRVPQSQPATRAPSIAQPAAPMPAARPQQSAPAPGGMSLDQASEFAYGPSSMNFNQSAIPTIKPDVPQLAAMPGQIPTVAPQAPAPAVPQPMPAAPGAIPGAVNPLEAAQQPSIMQQLLGGISPAKMAGGIAGTAIAGPIGGVAGRLIAPAIGRALTPSRTTSIGTGSNSGGPYQGQDWRNDGAGGTWNFNPSSRNWQVTGGSNAGRTSGNIPGAGSSRAQAAAKASSGSGSSSGSGGGLLSSIGRAISSIFN